MNIADVVCPNTYAPLRMVKYLDRICEDCYMLYRDSDVYTMCRYRLIFACNMSLEAQKVRSKRSDLAKFYILLHDGYIFATNKSNPSNVVRRKTEKQA